MGQLDAIQKCAHGELSRTKKAKRYLFTLACATCEIDTFSVRWSVEALRFLGGHVKHRTWITATQTDGESERPIGPKISVEDDAIARLKAGPMTATALTRAMRYHSAERLERHLERMAARGLLTRSEDGRWAIASD